MRMGERAAEWARATFTAANYARHLAAIAIDAGRSAPVFDVLEHAVKQLHAWGEASDFITLPETIRPLQLFEGSKEGDEA